MTGLQQQKFELFVCLFVFVTVVVVVVLLLLFLCLFVVVFGGFFFFGGGGVGGYGWGMGVVSFDTLPCHNFNRRLHAARTGSVSAQSFRIQSENPGPQYQQQPKNGC